MFAFVPKNGKLGLYGLMGASYTEKWCLSPDGHENLTVSRGSDCVVAGHKGAIVQRFIRLQ